MQWNQTRVLLCGLLVLVILTLAGWYAQQFKSDIPVPNRIVTHTGEPVSRKSSPDYTFRQLPDSLRVIRLDEPMAAEAERQRANQVLLYVNNLQQVLHSYQQEIEVQIGGVLNEYQAHYTAHAPKKQLPPLLSHKELLPSRALFEEGFCVQLQNILSDMDKALADAYRQVEELELYVADTSIVDNGVRGRKLVQNSQEALDHFHDQHAVLLGLCRAEAEAAEKVLLKGHPLRPQVEAMRYLLGRIQLTPAMIAGEKPDPFVLRRWRLGLDEMIEEAGLLPCVVSGAPEQHWRQFLNVTRDFSAVIQKGETDGFGEDIRKEINRQYMRLIEAQQRFAQSVNQQAGS